MSLDASKVALLAPEIVRLLLSGMEVCAADFNGNHETCLTGCGGYGKTAREHASDCALVAVLVAIGALER